MERKRPGGRAWRWKKGVKGFSMGEFFLSWKKRDREGFGRDGG